MRQEDAHATDDIQGIDLGHVPVSLPKDGAVLDWNLGYQNELHTRDSSASACVASGHSLYDL